MNRIISPFFAVILLLTISVKVSAQSYKIVCVGFYNLENLFDTIADPDTNKILQYEYTPKGNKVWDSKKYQNKLENMARVIAEIGTDQTPDGAAVLGVSEIENRQVLEDLVAMPALKARNYKIAHIESPDRRGIDVGLLYQEKYFQLEKISSYILHMADDPDFKTRNQILVSGKLDGEDVEFIVGHWPSRRGGQKASAPNRNAAAALGRTIVDSLLTDNPSAKIILMGDLNDDPVDESLTMYLRASGKMHKLKKGELYNTMWDHFKKGNGSLAWNDAWNLFDQIVISQGLIGDDASSYVFHQSYVFKRDYLFQKEGRFAGYPLRTHAAGQYMNGFSDHLPTYILLKKKVS